MQNFLRKRAMRAQKRFNCNGSYAFDIARAYYKYLNGIETDSECVWFDEFMDQYEN